MGTIFFPLLFFIAITDLTPQNPVIRPFSLLQTTISQAKVISTNPSYFIISIENRQINVQINSDTQFFRHFWGQSSYSDLQTNHQVEISGTWQNSTDTLLRASFIRNLSQNDWFIVAIGRISSLSPHQLTISSPTRGQLIIPIPSSISITALKIGDLIRIIGTLDRSSTTFSSVSQIQPFKYFSTPTSKPQSDSNFQL